ncbi:MAG: hypothetical protein R3F11_26695 [Verrucomicrobiales bacterium]
MQSTPMATKAMRLERSRAMRVAIKTGMARATATASKIKIGLERLIRYFEFDLKVELSGKVGALRSKG